jgi:hypothetical protein
MIGSLVGVTFNLRFAAGGLFLVLGSRVTVVLAFEE